jgi:hypothetical protein
LEREERKRSTFSNPPSGLAAKRRSTATYKTENVLMTNPTARLPAKLHRRVCLVLTEDAVLAEELLARKKLATEVAGRLSDKVLLVRPGRLDAVLDELRKMGHTPQVVGK